MVQDLVVLLLSMAIHWPANPCAQTHFFEWWKIGLVTNDRVSLNQFGSLRRISECPWMLILHHVSWVCPGSPFFVKTHDQIPIKPAGFGPTSPSRSQCFCLPWRATSKASLRENYRFGSTNTCNTESNAIQSSPIFVCVCMCICMCMCMFMCMCMCTYIKLCQILRLKKQNK